MGDVPKPAEEVWTWLKGQLGDKASMLLATLIFVALGIGWARAEVREANKDELTSIEREQARQRILMERYESDVHEFAKDLRELYRVSPTRRSERLERPFPDHGDGGE